MSVVKLGSWNCIRGHAEPIRYLLLYCNVPFDDYRFTFGNTGPNAMQKTFLLRKLPFDFDFPSFPFLVDGQNKITKSIAILKYLAQKCGLTGMQNSDEQTNEEMLEGVITDVRHHFIANIYFQSVSSEKELERKLHFYLSSVLVNFEKWIGDKRWLLSQQRPSYVDFMAFEVFDWYRIFLQSTDAFAGYPQMSSYMSRFEALPRLQAYLRSDTHLDAYCVSPFVAGKTQTLRHRLKKSFEAEVKEE